MTYRELLNFLLKQPDECLDDDVSVFINDNEEFYHGEGVYYHDENDPDFGGILDDNHIVIEC
jgi:hypothetical protein